MGSRVLRRISKIKSRIKRRRYQVDAKKKKEWLRTGLILLVCTIVVVALFAIFKPGPNYDYPPKPKPESNVMELRNALVAAIFPVSFKPDASKDGTSVTDTSLWNRPFGHLVTVMTEDNGRRFFYVPDPESYRGFSNSDVMGVHKYQFRTFRLLAAEYLPDTNVIMAGVRFRRIQIDRIKDPQLPNVKWIIREAERPYIKK